MRIGFLIFLGYDIEWNGEWVKVRRADVRCTNGIVHIIDNVLVAPNDIKVPVDAALKLEWNLLMALSSMFVLSLLRSSLLAASLPNI